MSVTAASALRAKIPYTVDTGEPLVNETFGPGDIRRRRTGRHEWREMPVHDGRALADTLSLDRNGFVLARHPTCVSDFFDARQIADIYYPEVETLIRETSGARRVVLFDHTLRTGDGDEQAARAIREPVLSAHNDYTEASGP